MEFVSDSEGTLFCDCSLAGYTHYNREYW